MSDAVDYIVVGAGSAGCVLANRLSANGQHSVCLLEAGPPDRSPWIHIPIGYGKTMFHKVLNWGYYTEPDPNMLDRRIYWPRGRTLGGSSAINGLIYIRGQRQDYDAWVAAGNPGWSWEECLPYFRKLENNDLGPGATRGTEGPLNATSIKTPHPLVEGLIGAARALGLPHVTDFNSGDQEGVGYYQLTTRNGRRCSTAVAYLRPARGRANLRVETGAHAMAVLFEGSRACGVRYRQDGQVRTLRARREVILCAGALQSPQLLQLSGVGPAALLRRFGIGVVRDLPGVGENLQDHLQIRLIYETRRPITTNDQLRTLHGRAAMGLQWLLFRGGPLAVGINQGGLFCRVDPASATPDTQFHFATLSADMAGGKVHPFSGCTYSVCQLRPSSRGTVRLRSADPFEAPAMQPNYLSTELDRRMTVAAVKYARRLAATEPLAGLMKREFRPGPDVQSDDEILHFCREYGATIFHPSGTAKMGPREDPMAVVDERLRVHGVSGLRVVDCSIMPTLVSGNTNVPVVMLAERAADFILQDLHAARPRAQAQPVLQQAA
ncbi:choline dehydrogenase [Achromobacter xylosoxidans]|uniref:GMC family oxidoreductase n=1 Tax=Alcaligenes xylosoxydans xylosoxydans TaxID=85698 RepID=UPI0006C0AC71|nr:choline dehydrogenase [Achromobacter xylosoxidans]OMG76919.1 choline dehydrogenase [Achromobacter xylosoxidans]QQE58756.1 choline dehydrogenase [Achromobacter xylosoxidans]QQV12501.1 choline dehydrogenase [Achromobacter xylosoxidans]UXL02551.1 choline dehydrogenase [Achromobacter xylosoxidans]CUI61448.1 Alcohol dehydrogenase [acceptor] [Achromobacter xylosoxidans]